MNLSRISKKMKTSPEGHRAKKSKFEAYFPYFDKFHIKSHENSKRKSSTRKNRCESVQSTRTSCKRSNTPVYSKADINTSEVVYNKPDLDNKGLKAVKRFVRTNQKSPKSFVVRHKKLQKSSDLTYDPNIGIYANRPISCLSRRPEQNNSDKVKDLNKYFEEFYEKSKVLLQKFEQNMKKGNFSS